VIWLLVALGLGLAVFGAASGASLLAESRTQLARAVSRRLRGADPSLAELRSVDFHLAVASATTSLGVLLLGAAVPAVFSGATSVRMGALLAFLSAPGVLFGAYLVPRWITERRAASVARFLLPALRPWARFVGNLLPARAARRPDDFRSIWREGAAVGVGADDELRTAGGVMAFAQRPVRVAMTPRTDVVALAEDASLEEIAGVFAGSGYSRVPVYRGTLDEIVGMLHAFDLFRLREGDPLPVRPVAATPASRTCGDLLLDMQRERRHLAVVLDEFGGTLGIVTLEDLLEELVGEIFDEHDENVEPGAAALATPFETDGATPSAAVAEHFGVTLPGGGAATVGGLLADLLGRIPAAGERFMVAGLEFDVVQASATRVERVVIRPGRVVPLVLAPADRAS
jgi:CBS domain containing-hemolysin-like protein